MNNKIISILNACAYEKGCKVYMKVRAIAYVISISRAWTGIVAQDDWIEQTDETGKKYYELLTPSMRGSPSGPAKDRYRFDPSNMQWLNYNASKFPNWWFPWTCWFIFALWWFSGPAGGHSQNNTKHTRSDVHARTRRCAKSVSFSIWVDRTNGGRNGYYLLRKSQAEGDVFSSSENKRWWIYQSGASPSTGANTKCINMHALTRTRSHVYFAHRASTKCINIHALTLKHSHVYFAHIFTFVCIQWTRIFVV